MDKVPESELLSAYLDGELTAAERAQVEQRLAADPAARQLAEEFRAWARRCNRCRGRRWARTSAPASSNWPSAACWPNRRKNGRASRLGPPGGTPCGMLSRQALTWSGLAVAIAVIMMIWGRPENRRVAVAPSPTLESPADQERSLTIQAPSAPVAAGSSTHELKWAEKAEPAAPAINRLAPPREKLPSGRGSLAKATDKLDGDKDHKGSRGGDSSSSHAGRESAKFMLSGLREAATPGILVVYCEVTPEAAHRRAFNSLLSRNGMSPTSAGEKGIPKPEQVYVDATISQIEALLDQLAANRDAFPAVSVKPSPGVDWQTDLVQHKRDSKSEAIAAKPSGPLSGSLAASSEPQVAAMKKPSLTPSAAPSPPKPAAKAKRSPRRDAAPAEELMADGRPAHVHRVLFVFRGVDDSSPKHGGR